MHDPKPMAKRWHSTLILVAAFVLGLAGGALGIIWAHPGMRPFFFHRPQRPTFVQYLQQSLQLTPAQVPKVQAIFQETGQRSHAIHAQFVPAYTKVCQDFLQVRSQEQVAFKPIRQEELQKMQGVLTATQWQKFQQQREAAMKRAQQQQADACRHAGGRPPGPPPGRGGPGGPRGPRFNGPPHP